MFKKQSALSSLHGGLLWITRTVPLILVIVKYIKVLKKIRFNFDAIFKSTILFQNNTE